MKISKIKIRNLFGITEQELDGQSVELTGENGVGKSSVIDAIRYALTNSSDRKFIIRNGENEGEILVETDSGLSIDRKARATSSDYKSIKQNGTAVGSPEAFLKTLFVPLQLNPMEFIQMSEKEQNTVILNMVQFEWDMSTIKDWFAEIPQDVNYDQNIHSVLYDIQKEDGYYFQHRQDINRDIRAKKAVINDINASLPLGYDGSIWENANIGELYTQIERIRKENHDIEFAKQQIDSHDQKIRKFQADREIALAALDREITEEGNQIDTEIASLEERLRSLRDKKATLSSKRADKEAVIESDYKASVAKFEAEIAEYTDLAKKETQPIDHLVNEADNTEKMKSHVGEWKRMLSIQEEVEKLESESRLLTEKIEKARTLPGEILETAEIPVKGLSVKDGVPLINGLPISNLSDGEKLSLCVDVAVQNPGGLQIILLDGVEALSEKNRELLYNTCRSKGIQFIACRTTDDSELTITEL
jgi:exonuclease SbcC